MDAILQVLILSLLGLLGLGILSKQKGTPAPSAKHRHPENVRRKPWQGGNYLIVGNI